MTLDQLSDLSTIISDSVSTIRGICTEKGLDIPDIKEPFTHQSENFRSDPSVADAVRVSVAAAFQLAAILEPPFNTLGRLFGGSYRAASLHALITTHVPEIMSEAGVVKGVHVDEIARKNAQDPKKIARLLRYLSSTHVFTEVSPDIFAHNRVSSILDTGKSPEQLILDPNGKHDGTSGVAAFIEFHLDVGGLSTRVLPDYLKNPSLRLSEEPSKSPFSHAVGEPVVFFDWVQRPEQEYRRKMYAMAMRGVMATSPPKAVLTGFPWKKLPPGSAIVDVGSGVGTVSLALAKALPHLTFVLQDVPGIISQAELVWNRELPGDIEKGRVKLQHHDFFAAQPVKDPAVFVLKQILHDWSDKYAHIILQRLREAAGPLTRLVIIEGLISYACPDPNRDRRDAIPGSVARQAPPPLLPNFGHANDLHMIIDICMLALHNAQERTFTHMESLCKEAGWKIVAVRCMEGESSYFQQIEAIPISSNIYSSL